MSTLVGARAAHGAGAGLAEMLASPAVVFAQRTLRHAYQGGEVPWPSGERCPPGTIRGHRRVADCRRLRSLMRDLGAAFVRGSRSGQGDAHRGGHAGASSIVLLGVNRRRLADLPRRQTAPRFKAAAQSKLLMNDRVELSIEPDAGPTYYDAEHLLPWAQRVIESRSEVALPAGAHLHPSPHQRTG